VTLPPEITITELTITPDPGSVTVEDQVQFTVDALFEDGHHEDMTTKVVWSSSDDSVALINTGKTMGGVAFGLDAGTVEITARWDYLFVVGG
jgi:hypothetical protein